MSDSENSAEDLVSGIEALEGKLAQARASITRRFIGQERVVDLTLTALLCGGLVCPDWAKPGWSRHCQR